MKENEHRLSPEEYGALLHVFGAVNGLTYYGDVLQKRLKSIPHGWQMFKTMEGMSKRLMVLLLDTIPVDKIMIIRRELENVKTTTKIYRDVTGNEPQPMAYVDTNALQWLIEKCMSYECVFCDKKGCELGKCQLRKAINATTPWDVAVPENGMCSLSGAKEIECFRKDDNDAVN